MSDIFVEILEMLRVHKLAKSVGLIFDEIDRVFNSTKHCSHCMSHEPTNTRGVPDICFLRYFSEKIINKKYKDLKKHTPNQTTLPLLVYYYSSSQLP